MVKPRNAVELLCDLHRHDQVAPLDTVPGLWSRQVDARWAIWVNGHAEPLRTRTRMEVQACDCYVEFNGWPAGAFSMIHEEGIGAYLLITNYESFCDALESAIALPLIGADGAPELADPTPSKK